MVLALTLGTAALAQAQVNQKPDSTGGQTVTVPVQNPSGGAVNPTSSPAVKPVTAPTALKLQTNKIVTGSMFLVVIAITMGIVVWASKRTTTAADFYVAGGGITGLQNGWAITGDYLSAATFLGVTGLISIAGIDGFMYVVGAIVAFTTMLLVIAEPCRNIGKYTLGDILSFRTSSNRTVRTLAALSTVMVSIFYLLAQMVGAGKLMQVLLGVPFRISVIGVGSLIIAYVFFGGMKATTWVQIIKATLIMASGILISFIILLKSGMNPVRFFGEVVSSEAIQNHVRLLLKHQTPVPGFDYGQRFLEPGLFLKNPLDLASLGMAYVFGTAGLPHILMRFFTVPNASQARKSVIIAMFLIGAFFVMTIIMGYGSSLHLDPQKLIAVDKGGNMSVLLLVQFLAGGAGTLGGDLFLAFVCAVTFTTILAVVSGLVLACSAAISHDIYVNIIKDGKAEPQQQVRVARITSFIVGVIAIALGIAAEKQNIVHLVALAFAVAASGNFPVLILTLFWKRFNTAGIISGLLVGTIVSVGLVMVSPNMTYPKLTAANAKKVVDTLEKKQSQEGVLSEKDVATLEKARADYAKNKDGKSLMGLDGPLFPLKNPGVVSIPLGFIAAIVGCLLFRDRRAEEMFNELYVRQNTGIGIASATDH